MTRVFADTFYFYALLSHRDAAHRRATEYSQRSDVSLITTPWVLTELANGLAPSSQRISFVRMLDGIRSDPDTQVVPATQDLFDSGVEFYRARPDKDWSLTDCISFVVMQQHGLTEALTGDRHFVQAGFRALLA